MVEDDNKATKDWPCNECRFWYKFFDTTDYTFKESCIHPLRFNPSFPEWNCTFGSEFKPKQAL